MTDEITELGDELCEKMEILSGLRDAPEPTPRAAPVPKPRHHQNKRKPTDPLDDNNGAIESPTGQPSPKVGGGVPKDKKLADILQGVPARQDKREGSVKTEDGDDAKGKGSRSSHKKSKQRESGRR